MASLDGQKWFGGRIPRKLCDKMLLGPGMPDGSFMVRESETSSGSYTLAVRIGQAIKNFRISNKGGRYSSVPGVEFDSVTKLVHHYLREGVSSGGHLIDLIVVDANNRDTLKRARLPRDPLPQPGMGAGAPSLPHRPNNLPPVGATSAGKRPPMPSPGSGGAPSLSGRPPATLPGAGAGRAPAPAPGARAPAPAPGSRAPAPAPGGRKAAAPPPLADEDDGLYGNRELEAEFDDMGLYGNDEVDLRAQTQAAAAPSRGAYGRAPAPDPAAAPAVVPVVGPGDDLYMNEDAVRSTLQKGSRMAPEPAVVVNMPEEQYDYNHLLPKQEEAAPVVVASAGSLYGNSDAIEAQRTGTSLNPTLAPRRAPAATPGGGGAAGRPPARAPQAVVAAAGEELYTDVEDQPPTQFQTDLVYE